MRVGLITVWYQAAAAIDRFAAELHALSYPNIRPVFVINALGVEPVARLRRAVPEAVVLEPGSNIGPAAAWNLGIARLLGEGVDAIGIWNVDTHFDPDCVSKLAEVLETYPDVGAVQPILLDFFEPTRVQMYGGSLDLQSGRASHDFKGANVDGDLPAMRDADYLDGGCMLVRASVLRRIGGFDERLFMYAEDCDLSLRIRRAGCRTVAVRDAHAWHEHREGPGYLPSVHEVFYITRNRFFLVRRYGGQVAWLSAVAGGLSWELPRGAIFYLRRRRWDLARALLTGMVSGAMGRMGSRT